MRYSIASWIVVCLLAHLTLAQTTRPARQRAERFGQRIEELVNQLDLSADQKQKVDDIIQQAREDFQKAMPELRDATPEQRRAKVQEILEGVRQETGDILTPEQKRKLQQLIKKRQADHPQANQGVDSPRRINAIKHPRDATPATRPIDLAMHEGHSSTAGEPGETAPNITMHWMNGDALHLSMYKGKVIVLVFGSYSTPTFRDKASALPSIAEKYNGRAKVLIVYTKEAHPSDGWTVERNKREGIEIAQPTDLAGRKAIAQQAITALHLGSIPMVLDSMDDSAANAFAAFPDGVVIIGKDGKIAAREHWLDPTALPSLIDRALKN